VLGGIDLVRRMAETGILGKVPVVMITSERNEAQAAELTRLGVKGCVHKPFYPEVLADMIRGVLGLGGAA
jgi:DNA-binding response OmpR family regulator